jgi:hypothetical protein
MNREGQVFSSLGLLSVSGVVMLRQGNAHVCGLHRTHGQILTQPLWHNNKSPMTWSFDWINFNNHLIISGSSCQHRSKHRPDAYSRQCLNSSNLQVSIKLISIQEYSDICSTAAQYPQGWSSGKQASVNFPIETNTRATGSGTLPRRWRCNAGFAHLPEKARAGHGLREKTPDANNVALRRVQSGHTVRPDNLVRAVVFSQPSSERPW